jgi:hypothetical protein
MRRSVESAAAEGPASGLGKPRKQHHLTIMLEELADPPGGLPLVALHEYTPNVRSLAMY